MSGYRTRGEKLGALVDQKQAAYGDSFGKSGKVMQIYYPKGNAPEQMNDALAIVRVIDKLFRIATDRDALGESPWSDIAGYGLLGAARVAAERELEPIPFAGPVSPACASVFVRASVGDGYDGRCRSCGIEQQLNRDSQCLTCFSRV